MSQQEETKVGWYHKQFSESMLLLVACNNIISKVSKDLSTHINDKRLSISSSGWNILRNTDYVLLPII